MRLNVSRLADVMKGVRACEVVFCGQHVVSLSQMVCLSELEHDFERVLESVCACPFSPSSYNLCPCVSA